MSQSTLLSNDQILEILTVSPVALAIYTTEDLLIQLANDAMLGFWGKDRAIIGNPLGEAVPELVGQPFIEMLRSVLLTGNTESGKAVPAETRINDKLQVRYYDFEYKALRNSDGEIYAVMHTANEVTDKMQNKYDFIGMVSHELKTPVTSLTGYLQLLQRMAKNKSDDFTEGILVKANGQLKKMTSMINGFLNISRLESGKIQLIKQDFRLDELIVELIDDVSSIVTTHQLTFVESNEVSVNGDRDKIGSVISNLLNNAVKYSPNKAKIEVACQANGGWVQVSIKDEGIGLDNADIDRVFQRFYRAENKDNPNISGFGIGLYLSSEIIQHHNGGIWVDSEKGKGSTFYFKLPLNS
ncbi:MAG: HAMP domain-containing histidine kinase [Pedobacter sp.]|nr:MAG: HAMP domain-containing histidine kinase [Pedobacter sp.]